MTLRARTLRQNIAGMKTSDGAGVVLFRSIGGNEGLRLDPFLMLDEFGTENPDDYIAGFPAHPHRGFETVTYMIDGHMRHQDHLGNVGELKSGGVQWMTAASGIIHSEMPQQESGRMRGFQLWINLPAKEKMKAAAYQDIPAAEIPVVELEEGGLLKVIAGRVTLNGETWAGPINQVPATMATDPLFLDLSLPVGQVQEVPVPEGHNAFVYVYEGAAQLGNKSLPVRSAGILTDGDYVALESVGAEPLRAIIVAGKPLKEPVVQYGPFVMNTRAEIEQALADYRAGTLTKNV